MNYIDCEKMEDFIKSSNSRTIAKIWVYTVDMAYRWGMYSLENFFESVDTYISEIKNFVDVEKIRKRAFRIRNTRLKRQQVSEKPHVYQILPIGFDSKKLEEIVPEFGVISKRFVQAIVLLPSSVEKAEAWLYAHALDAGANASIEAVIYFKSKGETLLSSDELCTAWKKEISHNIATDIILHKNNEEIISKALKNELTLSKLADVCYESNYFPNFLYARDEEEEYITASFFRAVEWFKLNEFEPWVNAFAHDISVAYQAGIDETYSLFRFFYLCRSDLVLKRASSFGLEAFLYGLCVGSIEPSKPWKRYWRDDESKLPSIIVDYIPTASVIAFAWYRINPTNLNDTVLQQAILLLYQTQLASGAWPLTSNDTEGNLFSTYYAMTALGVNRPDGYERYLCKAKDWLMSQQNEVGCWYIPGGPAIMINILCLEAIKLSEGSCQISYNVQSPPRLTLTETSPNVLESNNYIVFCEGYNGNGNNTNFDERCYSKIFASEFPNAKFCSVGSCKDIESEVKLLFEVIKKVNPYHLIIRLIDRDDRSIEEILELKQRGITTLSLRELESYLLDDELIEKLCKVSGNLDKLDNVLAIKAEALKGSVGRGHPDDDLKSASGEFFTKAKKLLGLKKCGNDNVSFLRDTMAPLLTPETSTYKLLRKDIFGE